MQRLKKNFNKVILFSFLVMGGCFYNNLSKDKGICYIEPNWAINIPNSKNKIYGVGIAGENITGENAQRRMAISRALNEIASQMQTKVKNIFINTQNSNGYKYSNSYTFQTIDNQIVSAKIIKSCKNPNNGMFYILMESELK